MEKNTKIKGEKFTINMLSQADKVKGQGVLSAYEEQVALVTTGLEDRFSVSINKHMLADITHIHTVNPGYFLSLPFLKAKGVTVGYVHFLPETLETSLHLPLLFRKIFYKYLMSFYASMDYLVTVNPCFIPKLEEYGIPGDKITYIPNYVSDKDFYPVTTEKRAELRKQYGLDPDKFTVICAGQLQTRKGVLDFAELARQLPQMQFLWAGGFSFGQMSDGYKEISRVLENHPENLIFPGMIEREKMNEVYNLGDVMLLPSYGELFPMTILEAMSSGVPILLRDLELYEDILFDFYLKAHDVEGFKEELLHLQNGKGYYATAKKKAETGHEFYHADHVLALWDTFYSYVVSEDAKEKNKKTRKLPAKSRGGIHFGKEF